MITPFRCPLEVGVKEGIYILIAEMEEGSEKPEFWSALGVKANTRSLYCSHLTGKSLGTNVRLRKYKY